MAFSTYAVRDLHSAVLSGFTYTAFSSEGQKAGLRQELLVINLLTDLHHHFHLSCKAQPVFPLIPLALPCLFQSVRNPEAAWLLYRRRSRPTRPAPRSGPGPPAAGLGARLPREGFTDNGHRE